MSIYNLLFVQEVLSICVWLVYYENCTILSGHTVQTIARNKIFMYKQLRDVSESERDRN